MPRKHTSVSNANSPGTASDQGVAHWPYPVNEDSEVVAVTDDEIYVQPSYGVTFSPLDNDIGVGLTITSVSTRSSTDGEVSTDGTNVTYLTGENFNDLECGEVREVTLDYTIEDVFGNTDNGLIVVSVFKQEWFWMNEDDTPILDEDGAFIAQCDDVLPLLWLNEDATLVLDEDEDVVIFETEEIV